MSYILVVSDVRKGVFDEKNLDSIGFASLFETQIALLLPKGPYDVNTTCVDTILKAKTVEEVFLNPLNIVTIMEQVFSEQGKPDFIVFTHSAAGTECASYASGYFSFPIITDVNGYSKDENLFYKGYYSDKIYGVFKFSVDNPYIITVRSGSFREMVKDRGISPTEYIVEYIPARDDRVFLEYVEEERSDIDITKAELLLSVGRGIGNKDEIPKYEELAQSLKAVLSCSRPVVDKLWLPKARQVGTSGKTVKPKVYLAMGISGAFQHIAGMKDSDCIIAVNKDPEAPIFQYAHFGVIADIHKVRDKLLEVLKG
jgi:electron transfer flavoprotein alpha subunit